MSGVVSLKCGADNQIHVAAKTAGNLSPEKKTDRSKGNGVFSLAEWEELIRQLNLSPRQSQIVDLLFKGLGDKQIAAQLGISIHTLRTYFDRMFAKMEVGDRCELIVRVFSEFRSGCDPTACPRRR